MTGIRPSTPEDPLLPREVVLASAGTGKTYALSSRLIGLLALGVPPDSLLATTFTRKAAGEILNRVLSRLAVAALDETRAGDLARAALLAPMPEASEQACRAFFSSLLLSLVRDLHRMNVGTLDSFFVRVARCFPGELGLPLQWTVADSSAQEGLEAEALQTVLSGAGRVEMAELVRMTMGGQLGRGVHERLLRQLKDLRSLLHQGAVGDPRALWSPPGGHGPGDTGHEPPQWQEILRLLETAPLPLTKKGEPDSRYRKAVETAAGHLRREEWAAFCGSGLVGRVMGEDPEYHGVSIPEPLREAIRRALEGVRSSLTPVLEAQARALRALVSGFDQALAELQRGEGAYGFQDITYLLGGLNPGMVRSDLWYRLDQRARHLLLDEFQDTSRAQWRALEPLAEELLAGHREDRSGVVVADPKQSIYGWRGAEPSLVRRVAGRFALEERTLDRSYRSARPILEFVNRVFGDLPSNPVWNERPRLVPAVGRWWESFSPHGAARELPGLVRLEVAPQEDPAGAARGAALLEWAAERVSSLHAAFPDGSIGVLVRRNVTAARVIALLRRLGVEVSEEGASALNDSAAVAALLALLRMADHPGDTVARYHVAFSPLGALVGLAAFDDAAQARAVALNVRRELLTAGYGPTLNRWVRELGARGLLSARDIARLLQLVEVGHRWDQSPGLRPAQFVRFVESQALEAPSSARVRVMTVHQAKGLEFDVVVLPELDSPLTQERGRREDVLPLRDPGSGAVVRIFPWLGKDLRPLFPELEDAARQAGERELTDALGVLYVALTRARHGLFLFVAPDPSGGARKIPWSFSGLLRGALDRSGAVAGPGSVLYHEGDGDWLERLRALHPTEAEARPPVVAGPAPEPRVAPQGRRTRLLPHRSPTDLGGRREIDLGTILSLDPSRERGRQVGTLVHAWLESFTWIEAWAPDPGEMRRIAAEAVPGLETAEVDRLGRELSAWLQAPEVREALSRRGRSASGTPAVRSEVPFAVRLEGAIYQGRMDRVVAWEEGGRVSSAEVLDFKTDALPAGDRRALEEAVAGYGPQMRIYRQALARLHGLPLEKTRAALVFLAAGRVMEVEPEG